MLALKAHTCDCVVLKSREQGTSSPPCARSAEYFLCPVTVHSIVPHPQQLSRQMSYDTCSSFFTATAYQSEVFLGSLSHTNTSATTTSLYMCNSSMAVTLSVRSSQRYVVKFSCQNVFVGRQPYENFSTHKFFQQKLHITKISQFTVVHTDHALIKTSRDNNHWQPIHF